MNPICSSRRNDVVVAKLARLIRVWIQIHIVLAQRQNLVSGNTVSRERLSRIRGGIVGAGIVDNVVAGTRKISRALGRRWHRRNKIEWAADFRALIIRKEKQLVFLDG